MRTETRVVAYDILTRLDNGWQARKAIELALRQHRNYDIHVEMPVEIRGDDGKLTIYASRVSYKWELNGNEKNVKMIGAYVCSPDRTKWSFVELPFRYWDELTKEA